jgi:hypothetical protein
MESSRLKVDSPVSVTFVPHRCANWRSRIRAVFWIEGFACGGSITRTESTGAAQAERKDDSSNPKRGQRQRWRQRSNEVTGCSEGGVRCGMRRAAGGFTKRTTPSSIGDWHFAHFGGSFIVVRFSTDGFWPATFESAQSLAWAAHFFVLPASALGLSYLDRRSTSRASSHPAGRSKVVSPVLLTERSSRWDAPVLGLYQPHHIGAGKLDISIAMAGLSGK